MAMSILILVELALTKDANPRRIEPCSKQGDCARRGFGSPAAYSRSQEKRVAGFQAEVRGFAALARAR
jgi:hypothetical protein